MNCPYLCVFPSLKDANAGGIQISGKLAWRAFTKAIRQRNECADLFCYGQIDDEDHWLSSDHAIVASSKFRAIVSALQRPWQPNLILFWHIGLLKLLPFFRNRTAGVVLFLHGIEAWKRHPFLDRLLLHRVDLFLSNSNFTWQRFLTFNPQFSDKPHRTVHLGIGKASHGCVPQPNTIPIALMLGRLMRSEGYKGHREMINAWPLVLKRIPEAQLWIAGDGDLRSELEQIVASRGLQKSVRFWGRVSEEQKEGFIRQCHCLALPSWGEGFGFIYLEAMRLGRPCLVSTLDAGREVVNPPEAGLAADPSDLYELANAICQLLTTGSRWNRWSKQAQCRYEGYFTTEHFQKRLIEALFEEVRKV